MLKSKESSSSSAQPPSNEVTEEQHSLLITTIGIATLTSHKHKTTGSEDRFAVDLMPDSISTLSPERIKRTIKSSMRKLEKGWKKLHIEGSKAIPPAPCNSGSTLIDCLVIPAKMSTNFDIYTTSLGDSNAILVKLKQNALSETECEWTRLNRVLHRPDVDITWCALHKGYIPTIKDKLRLNARSYDNPNEESPVIFNNRFAYVWRNEKGLCYRSLSVTRSIGDYRFPDLLKQPDIAHDTSTISSNETHILILASDGLEKVINSRLFKEILIAQYNMALEKKDDNATLAQAIASSLVTGISESVCNYDDATIVALPLDFSLRSPVSIKIADGHAGSDTAEYVVANHGRILSERLEKALTKKQEKELTKKSAVSLSRSQASFMPPPLDLRKVSSSDEEQITPPSLNKS